MTFLGLIGVIVAFHSKEAEDSEDILPSLIINASLPLWIGAYRMLFKHAQWKSASFAQQDLSRGHWCYAHAFGRGVHPADA